MDERLQSLALRDPRDGTALRLTEGGAANAAGTLVAPWKNGVLCFEGEAYADNFGWQWNEFDKTQLDSTNQDSLSRDRLLMTLGLKAEELRGKLVLEAGSGAGRFTEQLLKCGAIVATLDASSAVEANCRQNASESAMFVRASIYQIPFAPAQFDIVICLGVLQHTPDREHTIRSLAAHLRPGGLLCVDSYRMTARRLTPSYLLRPLFARLSAERVQKLSHGYVEAWWPMRALFRRRWARMAAWAVSPIAPIFYYWAVSKNRDDAFLKQWAILDTHDFLSPQYDTPQTRGSFRRMLQRAGLVDVSVEDLSKVPTADGRIVSGFHAGRARARA